MEFLIAALISLTVGMVAYQVWPLPSGYWGKSLGHTLATDAPEPELPFWRGVLTAFKPIVKYTPLGWSRAIEGQLYWAQLTRKWPGWALPEVMALHVAVGGVGVVLGGFISGDVTLALAAMAALPFMLNLIYLNAHARRARRQLSAELPEFVSLLAAESVALYWRGASASREGRQRDHPADDLLFLLPIHCRDSIGHGCTDIQRGSLLKCLHPNLPLFFRLKTSFNH